MILRKIDILLPNLDTVLSRSLLKFLSHFGEVSDNHIEFSKSSFLYFPTISFSFENFSIPVARFYTDSHPINIELVNKTGIEKKSTHKYSHIEMNDFLNRISDIKVTYLDHVGFDLPWFSGVHPEILELRKSLSSQCLYHLFPTGEPWDFILPGTEQEIMKKSKINYSKVRKPKFEIVSLDTVSTPLIQIDFSVKEKYEKLVELFPEAIHDQKLRNMWVYIKNRYKIDICFVINEHHEGDWSDFFTRSLQK